MKWILFLAILIILLAIKFIDFLVKTKKLKKTTTIPLQIIVVDGGLIALPIQEIFAMIILAVVTAAGMVAVAAEIDIFSKKGSPPMRS